MARTAPSPATRNVGDGLTAAYMNSNVRDAVTFLTTPPIARIHQNTTQNIATGTWTAVSMDGSDFDSDNGHSNSTNNTRYTCQVQGYYRVAGTSVYAPNFVPLCSYAVNGTRVSGAAQVGMGSNAGTSTSASCEDLVHLNVGDYVELMTFQNTGSTVATAATSDFRSVLTIEWRYAG